MTIIRQSLIGTLAARSTSLGKDQLIVNAYPEQTDPNTPRVIRRFGYKQVMGFAGGQALGLFTFGTQSVSIVGSQARLGPNNLGTVNAASQYQYTTTGANTGFFLKNNTASYIYDGSSFSQVTDVNYPTTTVPGVVYLDGFVFVLTPSGRVYNSNVNAPSIWNALNFISTRASDAGVAISRLQEYVVAFGQNNTTFFYDAANAAGSPLLPNNSVTINIGCAHGNSVVQTKNTIFWLGQTKQRGRSIYLFDGFIPRVISTPYVDRLLSNDALTNVYSYFIELNGHNFYVLTLKASNLTLVYDLLTNDWVVWSSSALGQSRDVTGGVINDHVVTLTIPSHGLTNGTVGLIAGNANPEYLGTFLINVIDQNTIQYTANQNVVRGGINAEEIDKVEVDANNIS